jgi:hypothetical protein
MKQKMKGCLRVFLTGLVIILVIGNVYGVVRMEWARLKLYYVAYQLDYTSAHYLYSTVEEGAFNMVTGGIYFNIVLYYTTPMTATAYRERLAQIDPSVFDRNMSGDYVGREVGITSLPRADENHDQSQARRAIQPPSPGRWRMPSYDVTIDFQTLSPQEYRVEYKGRTITDNVAKLTVGGVYLERWFMLGVFVWEKLQFFGV